MRFVVVLFCSLFVTLALSAQPEVALTKIAEGRAALAAHDLTTARARFVEARAADPANETAAALSGLTRWMALVNDQPAQDFLNRFGVTPTGRDVYNWTATLPTTPEGEPELPENFNWEEARSFWIDTLLATAAAARADFAAVTTHNFELTLTAQEVGSFSPVVIDRGDLLMCQSALRAVEVFGNLFYGALHLDADISQVMQLASGDLFTLRRLLNEHPNLLVAGPLARREALRESLLGLVDIYRRASIFVRNRPAGIERLFMLDDQDLAAEAELRRDFARLEQAVHGYVEFEPGLRASLTPMFSETWSPRAGLPSSPDGKFNPFTVADTSFGGLIIGMSREEYAHTLVEMGYVADLGWEPVTQSFSQTLTSYIHTGTQHVVLGMAGVVGRSANGETGWSFAHLPMAQDFQAVAMGAGKLVAVTQTQIWISTDDGATWSQVVQSWRDYDDTNQGQFTDLTHGASGFVAVSSSGIVWRSLDGENWTSSGPVAAGVSLAGVAFGNGVYVAVGQMPVSGQPRSAVLTSADGSMWNVVFTGATTAQLRAIGRSGNTWVAAGAQGRVAYSSGNLAAWTEISIGNTGDTFFRATHDGTRFVLSGVGGRVAVATTPSAWSIVTATDLTPNFLGAATTPAGVALVGSAGSLYRLVNGTTFSRLDTHTSQIPRNVHLSSGVVFGGKLYLPGSNGTVYESANGTTFVARATGTTLALNAITVHNNELFAVGNTGTIVSSTDGATWQVRLTNNAAITTSPLFAVASHNGMLIAGGAGGTVLTSDTGGTWTKRTTPTAAAIRSIAYGDGVYVLGLTGALNFQINLAEMAVLYSTDLQTWQRTVVSSTPIPTPAVVPEMWGVTYHDGSFYGYVSNGIVLRSYGAPSQQSGWWWEWMTSDMGNLQGGAFINGGHYVASTRSGAQTGSALYYAFDEDFWVRAELPFSAGLGRPIVFQNRLYLHGGSGTVFRGPVLAASGRPAPLSTAMPTVTVASGGTVGLTAITAASEPLSFQWSVGGTPITGATSSVLTLRDVTAGGVYTLTATGLLSGETTQRNVTVAVAAAAPRITSHPLRRAISVGQPLTLSVGAAGTGPLTYQWYKGETALVNQTGATLQIASATLADSGLYYVTVTNAAGTTRSFEARVRVAADIAGFWRVVTPNSATGGYTPGRTIHDGNGRLYALWNTFARPFDVLDGSQVKALVRLDEATGALDPSFVWDDSRGFPLFVSVQSNGKLLVAVGVGEREGHTVVRVNSDGSHDSTFTAPYFTRGIRFMTLQSDGKVIVAVTETASTTTMPSAIAVAQPSIYRLNTDGTIDNTFTVATLNAAATLFGEPAIDAAGRIYLAGSFTQVNGTARTNVARLNANGTLDTTFAASLPTGFASTQARGVALQSDGRAVFVGDFRHNARGNSGNPIMAIRFNADGTYDSTFAQPLRSELPLNPGLFGRLRYLVMLPNDTFYGISDALVRFTANGARDLSFSPPTFPRESFWISRSPTTGNLFVTDMAFDFEEPGKIAAFTPAGALVTSFLPREWGYMEGANMAMSLPDGRLLVTGNFNRYGDQTVPAAALLNASGELSDDFSDFLNPGARPLSGFARFAVAPDRSFFMLRGDNGDAQASGSYFSLSRHFADGTADEEWEPMVNYFSWNQFTPAGGGQLYTWLHAASASNALNPANSPAWILRFGDGGWWDSSYQPNLSALVQATRDGNNTITQLNIGRILNARGLADGRLLLLVASAQGDVRLVRLLQNGMRDQTFAEPVFGAANGGTVTQTLFDPVRNQSYSMPVTTFISDLVTDWLMLPDGRMYLTGRFQINGRPRGIVRLLPSGAFDQSFGGTGLEYQGVHALGPRGTSLALDDFGRVYVTGRFTAINGHAASGIARFANTGALDTNWTPGITLALDNALPTRVVGARGQLHVLGGATATGGNALAGYARTTLAPTTPVIYGHAMSRSVPAGTSVVLFANPFGGHQATFQWYKGGTPITGATSPQLFFSSFGAGDVGTYRFRVTNAQGFAETVDIVMTLAAPPVITQQPTSRTVTMGGNTSFSVSATDATSYQWFHNGQPINGATSPTLPLNNVSGNQAGTYTVVVSNIAGQVTSDPATLTVSSGLSGFLATHFNETELANVQIGGPNADPDRDGLSNLLEYALGQHPRSATTSGLPEAGTTATHWTFIYTRPADRGDLIYDVQASTNLTDWTSIVLTVGKIAEGNGTETWRAQYPLSSASNLFFRLRVTIASGDQ